MKGAPILGDPTTMQQSGGDFSISLITGEEEFARLGQAWPPLEEEMRDATPFSSFEWAYHWWQEFGHPTEPTGRTLRNPFQRSLHRILLGQRDLYVIVGRQASAVRWIAPFVCVESRSAGFPIRCLEFLTAPDAGCHNLLLAGDHEHQVESLVRFLCERQREWDCLNLRHMPNDSRTPELLANAARRSGLKARVRPDRPKLVVQIQADWETTLRGKSKTAREVFRNQANRLERAGAIFRVLPDPSSEPGLVTQLAAVEASKRVKGFPTLRLLPGRERFYDALFQALGPRQKMYVALLEMDNRLIAYEWGFRTPDRILPYNKAYLPEYGRFSPGTMLVPAVIDFGYRQGCREYDFSRGEQPYKWRWATESRPSLRVEIWSPRIRSRLARIGFLSVRPLALRALSALRIRYTPSWEL